MAHVYSASVSEIGTSLAAFYLGFLGLFHARYGCREQVAVIPSQGPTCGS